MVPLGFQLLHPQYHVRRVYEVEVNGPLLCSPHRAISEWDFIHRRPYLQACLLDHSRKTPSYSKAQVRISEGKYHQVKKMFLAIGVKVITLKRLSFGPFTLDPSSVSPLEKAGPLNAGGDSHAVQGLKTTLKNEI